MKPVGGPGRVWHCSLLKQVFRTMASQKDSSLTPLLQGMLTCVGLPHLKTLTTRPQLRQWMPESSMTKMMQLHLLQLQRVSTLHQVLLHHRISMTTLLPRLHRMGTSRRSMSSNLFGPHWQKGEKHMRLIVFKRVHMGGCFIFCFVLTTLVLLHLVLWVVTLKLDGRLLLICYSVMQG